MDAVVRIAEERIRKAIDEGVILEDGPRSELALVGARPPSCTKSASAPALRRRERGSTSPSVAREVPEAQRVCDSKSFVHKELRRHVGAEADIARRSPVRRRHAGDGARSSSTAGRELAVLDLGGIGLRRMPQLRDRSRPSRRRDADSEGVWQAGHRRASCPARLSVRTRSGWRSRAASRPATGQ